MLMENQSYGCTGAVPQANSTCFAQEALGFGHHACQVREKKENAGVRATTVALGAQYITIYCFYFDL